MPSILATGFVIDPSGIVVTNRHVVMEFPNLPKDPATGKPALTGMLCQYGVNEKGKEFIRTFFVEPQFYAAVDHFTSEGKWFGDDLPDIGFVQLALRGLPSLTLARHDRFVQPGMAIGTIGYPMGHLPLTVMNKINQQTPFIRQGIVSSVYPFPIPQPHGFTIDIMQQGGSSGSPIFPVDKAEVVGMMASSLPDYEQLPDETFQVQNTNISICVTSTQIANALEAFRKVNPANEKELQSLPDYLASLPMDTGINWNGCGPRRLVE